MSERQGPRLGKNLVAFAGLVVAVVVIVAGIAIAVAVTQSDSDDVEPLPTPVPTETPELTSTDVELSIDGSFIGPRLNVRGTATVPNGAYVVYQLNGPEGCTDCEATGRVNVQNGEFAVSIDVSAWGAGEIRMWAAFQMPLVNAEQPTHVVELYGEDGGQMTGDTVVVDGITRVEVEETVEFGGVDE